MKTYECIEVDISTKNCINWQEQQVLQDFFQKPPISKQEANELTLAIIGFMIFVHIWKQILSFLK